MEHTRFLRRLIIDSSHVQTEESEETVLSVRELEESERAELERLCQAFDQAHYDARQKLWDLMKIPIAPATIIALSLEGAVALGILQKEIGHCALILDIVWASYKLYSGLLARSQSAAGMNSAVIRIQTFLHTHNSRTAMVYRDIICGHEPDLRETLLQKEAYL